MGRTDYLRQHMIAVDSHTCIPIHKFVDTALVGTARLCTAPEYIVLCMGAGSFLIKRCCRRCDTSGAIYSSSSLAGHAGPLAWGAVRQAHCCPTASLSLILLCAQTCNSAASSTILSCHTGHIVGAGGGIMAPHAEQLLRQGHE